MRTMYEGNLRLFSQEPPWADSFRAWLGENVIFAENAFGTQYCVSPAGNVSILWPESGDVEDLEISKDDFFQAIAADAVETIDQDFFLEAVAALGPIETGQHYAFKVELALGGGESIDNVQVMDAMSHMSALAQIAAQIHEDVSGTTYEQVIVKN